MIQDILTDLDLSARIFAIGAHSAIDQRRKYTGEPYWQHCQAVAHKVMTVTADPSVIAAAWLHDVIEDTKVDEATMRSVFGSRITELVLEVTDVSAPDDGNREARKAIDRSHNAKASANGQTIKVADLIDNTRSIVANDPGFAKIYMAEKAALLDVLPLAHPALMAEARAIVDAYQKENAPVPILTDEQWLEKAKAADSLSPATLDLDAINWREGSDDEDPRNHMIATLMIGSAYHHLEAFAIHLESDGERVDADSDLSSDATQEIDNYEFSADELWNAFGMAGHADTVMIEGRQYVLFASPFNS